LLQPASTAPDLVTAPVRRRRSGLPPALLVPAGLALAFLVLPLVALVLRAPWRSLPELLLTPQVGQALRLSLVCATSATVLCLLLGVPLAWVLARSELPGRRVVRALVTVPLVLPPVVGGVALLLLLGRRGLLGQYLDTGVGVTIPFTTGAVVIAVEGALRGADSRYEDAAATLGASRWLVFWKVTLPMVAPGVAAGSVLCFARALGEFGATITFAGSYPGKTQTMPIAVYSTLESGDTDGAIVLSLVLLVVSVTVLVSLRDRWLTGATT